jgi:hypothetical protein
MKKKTSSTMRKVKKLAKGAALVTGAVVLGVAGYHGAKALEQKAVAKFRHKA